MTRKFEQEETPSYINYKMDNKQKKPIPNDPEALDDFCEEVQISSWAIKAEQAHLKQMAQYSNVDEDL
jgi:hypothetical protein